MASFQVLFQGGYPSHYFCVSVCLHFLIQVIVFVIHCQYGVVFGSRKALKQTRAKKRTRARCGHGSCPNEDGEEGSSGDCGEILWKADLGFSDARILQRVSFFLLSSWLFLLLLLLLLPLLLVSSSQTCHNFKADSCPLWALASLTEPRAAQTKRLGIDTTHLDMIKTNF